MKSLLPVILVLLLLTGAITYSLSKRVIPKAEENRFGIPANEIITPTPVILSESKKRVEGSPSITPAIAEPVLTALPSAGQKGGSVTRTTKTIVCTPVYGQANTCTEHIVVDTGAQDSIFFNFAGLSYLAGLASFVFAKRA
ncbi:MAG: hypothetical protein UX08_C0024G0003 [Candidatus Collierbacteria bacterium GW2011_GWB1_45_35]|uniref:Uncharacterized protein n=2 Tax=Candidatus Collieribacteriota TaxID=1752725 RepID=A0A0G1NNP4_9BACT|nr:MAG: hypothetical protein UW48_C0021G0003 [Microgenomates group bacterium GW2011_GWC1_44_23]KKT85834.1 MAG: hypothetical protein UW84_C0021G0003 [Candidatus Collierbacteria bacterium GW2011_GWA2_44_99]KKT94619.1 MAG: hypothetical protein UW96_C0018G0006 [Candidatus Collierbacteria bacterium GW2011_GWA1_45_15]KKT99404.1 MAG: hypothetical protein UX01_C0010G0036 [Candidatus Collierbacteria bacterium GW2011_GWB2_45_17]KKU04502.1 MAG: hypothetical protein UX08_C0024G0003 [Candidatus Collierbacte